MDSPSSSPPPPGQQDLGDDFHFESDSGALQSILNLRGLTPKLKPIATPHRYRKFEDRYDFFEGKNGTVFYRPSARFNRPDAVEGSAAKGASQNKTAAFRGFQRGLNLGPPKRVVRRSRSPILGSGRPKSHRKMCLTEKRFVPLNLPDENALKTTTAAGISERRPMLPINGKKSKLPRPTASKALDFDLTKSAKAKNKENVKEGPDDFARPLDPSPVVAAVPQLRRNDLEGRSMAELILLRESLSGLCRESYSALLRQSLTPAELVRMFEDDSTTNFENLEKRLKTPKRPPPKAKVTLVGAGKDEEDVDSSGSPSPPRLGEGDDKTPEEFGQKVLHEEKRQPDVSGNAEVDAEKVTADRQSPSEPEKDSSASKEPETEDNDGFEKALDEDEEAPSSKTVLYPVSEAEQLKHLYQEQQDLIDAEMLKLMEQSRKRREQFKLSWGVSPRSINMKRTVKTMIVCPSVAMSREFQEQQGTVSDSEATEQRHDRNPPGSRDPDKDQAIERIVEELKSTELDLARAAKADSHKGPDFDEQEMTDCHPDAQDVPCGLPGQEVTLGDGEDDRDGLEGDDGEEEAPGELSLLASLDSRNIDWFSDVFGAGASLDLAQVSEKADDGGSEEGGVRLDEDEEEEEERRIEDSDVLSDDNEECEMEMTQIEVCKDDSVHDTCTEEEPRQIGSKKDSPEIVVCDQELKQKKKKRQSVVRFAEGTPPQFGRSEIDEDPQCEQGHDDTDGSVRVKISVPIHIGSRSTTISFTERRRSANVHLHQPTPHRPRAAASKQHTSFSHIGTTTPAALRSISDRAQAELASLYKQEEDDDIRTNASYKIDFDN